MIRNSFTYTQIPSLANSADYDKAREWIIDYVSKHKDVLALYEYGTVTIPGISDLDLIMIVRDEPEDKNLSSKMVLDNIPKSVLHFLSGRVLKIISKDHFRDLSILGPIRPKLLYGRNLALKQRGKNEKDMVLICNIMDWLAERTLVLLCYEKIKRIPVTDLIGYMKSFCISVKSVNKIIKGKSDIGRDYCNEVDTLRHKWFGSSRKANFKKLQALLYGGIETGCKLMGLFSDYLIKNGYYIPTDIEETSYFYINEEKGYVFARGNSSSATVSVGKSIFIKTPRVWLTHLLHYSRLKGVISQRICDNLVINGAFKKGKIDSKLGEVLDKRISLCNGMALYFKKYNFKKGLYRFANIKEVRTKN